MGYSTDFTGKLFISPPLTPEQAEEINMFCEERHGGDMNAFPGMPGFWCDWQTDGASIFWNGNEKSYDMAEWLALLIKKFFTPWCCIVNGRMLAEGEHRDDTWVIDVQNSVVKVVPFPKVEALGITT